jgi:primosomal protein N' (replication factor Y)
MTTVPKMFDAIISVLLPVHISQIFSYRTSFPVEVGQCVKVPFGKKILWGVVWDTEGKSVPQLKYILEAHPHFAFDPRFLTFLQKCADYTLMPLGKLFHMALPIPEILTWPNGYFRCTPKTNATLKLCPWPGSIAQWIYCLGSKKALTAVVAETLVPYEALLHAAPYEVPALNAGQTLALKEIPRTGTTFIEGVTGSGKTELCLAYIKYYIDRGDQVLILVPEINLCQQWVLRLQHYYAGAVGVWHSGISARERKVYAWNIASGMTSVIVGARSACMLHYHRLGCIIVDEEHDGSYKQDEGYAYHARDMAVYRAHYQEIPCLLLSATPSLETYYNVQQNRYHHITLAARYGNATLPDIRIIDLKQSSGRQNSILSLPLKEALLDTLKRGEQSLIFVNRRGYGSLWVCYKCGYRAACVNCSVWLSVHYTPKPTLLCHYCGFKQSLHTACPQCQGEEGVRICGVGVEKVCEEIQHFLPEARLCTLSSDMYTTAQALNTVLQDIHHQKYDILIGTQLIAKGHHFPKLTTVGIVDGDFALSHLDLRSAERLYQILCQVVGRAGRGQLAGTAYIQTSQSEHMVFQYLAQHQLQNFLQEELMIREAHHFPPYARLILVTLSGLHENRVHQHALRLKQHFTSIPEVDVLGPAPSPINPLRRKWRWRIFFKSPKNYPVQQYVQQHLHTFKCPASVQLHVDVDPYDFL